MYETEKVPILRVEFHCHTIYSQDSLFSPNDLVPAGKEKGIDKIIVTDHNTIAGALLAQQIDPGRVIIGEEIMTKRGELLAAFIEEEIPAGLEPLDTIILLKMQGAFISVSHPFDRWRGGHWQLSDLLKIVPFIDAIETFNARCMLARFNREAKEFAHKQGLKGTVGSDAHTAYELGKATMLLPFFSNAADLRVGLDQSFQQVSLSSPIVHLFSRYADWRKKSHR